MPFPLGFVFISFSLQKQVVTQAQVFQSTQV